MVIALRCALAFHAVLPFAATELPSSSQAASFSYLNNECPLDADMQKPPDASNSDTYFCGMLFRKIADPTWLQNWQAIPVRASDIWFATLPPSGSAKAAGMNAIKELTGAKQVSGHTEFSGPDFNLQENGRRLIGTHVPFEWLPTQVLATPAGQEPCKVVFLVREPKENLAAGAAFSSKMDVEKWSQYHIDAALGDEKLAPNRGFAAYSNGYAAAVGVNGSGPDVLLLSQSRLADAGTVAEEVARLAAFLEVDFDADQWTSKLAEIQSGAAKAIGDASQMSEALRTKVDETFAAPKVDPRVAELYGEPQFVGGKGADEDGGGRGPGSTGETPAGTSVADGAVPAVGLGMTTAFSLVIAAVV